MAALVLRSGVGLGFMTLGAGLQDILTMLIREPKRFPKLDVSYSADRPLEVPVIITLPENGLRLRFDGPEQRLRLIEVLDLTKDKFIVKNESLVPPPDVAKGFPKSLLYYRRVYQLFGASYPGEYQPPTKGSKNGTYVVSYPGIALNFPIDHLTWSPSVDHAKLLSNSSSAVSSVAIFEGKSWADARRQLFVRTSAFPRTLNPPPRIKEGLPDEIETVRIADAGKMEVVRRTTHSIFLTLHQTTQQDLIADLGPPDYVYKRPTELEEGSDHTLRPNRRRSSVAMPKSSYGSTPSSVSSTNTETYDADFEEDDGIDGPDVFRPEEQYYCYYQHGFDILLGTSSLGPTVERIVLHGNIPGSYPFNRHRRCRWSLEHINPTNKASDGPIDSETCFKTAHPILLKHFKGAWPEKEMKEGMVIVGDWGGDSPSGSAILIGESADEEEEGEEDDRDRSKDSWLKNTKLYKFPGLMFEVMDNGAVTALTVH